MLPRVHRLTSGDSHRRVVRSGRRAGTRTLVVHLLVVPEPERPPFPAPPTVGFVVSRAVGNAVTRNAVKRRLRHLVGERLAGLPAGAQLVVRALPAAAGASSADLGADLDKALARTRPEAAA